MCTTNISLILSGYSQYAQPYFQYAAGYFQYAHLYEPKHSKDSQEYSQ